MNDINNKKILIVINNLGVGGAERVVVNDLNEMLRQGVSVRLLTLKNESSFSLFLDCAIEKNIGRLLISAAYLTLSVG